MKRPGADDPRVKAGGTLKDDDFSNFYPQLWEYMSEVRYDDGSPRTPSSLLIFQADGLFKGMLRDADAGLCLWVAADSISGLLVVLDARLSDPQAEWRVDRRPGQNDAAKRQKRG